MAEETKAAVVKEKTERVDASKEEKREKPTEKIKEKKVEEVKSEPVEEESLKEKVGEKSVEVKKSSPAVAQEKKSPKEEKRVELEREYVIPLRKEVLKVPAYKRAKKAIRAIKEFLAKHMRVDERDVRKVKIDMYLNNEVWFKGIKKPLMKVKVIARKIDGVVYAELAEIPDVVKYAKARHEKRKLGGKKLPSKGKDRLEKEEAEDKNKDGVADKVEEDENKKSGAIKEAKEQKAIAKDLKHTKGGAHKGKTAPVRKTLR